MRHPLVLHVVVALTLATACSDSPSTGPSGVPAAAPAGSSPGVPQQNATLGFSAREILVGQRVILAGPLVSLDRYTASDAPLSWRSTDPTVVTLFPDGSVAFALGAKRGVSVVTVTGGDLTANIPITVLEQTTAPAPVVVEDFYVIEYGEAGNWGYAPQIVLRDSSGTAGSAVIGVSFDLPVVGATPRCFMLRPIGAQAMELFHESYGDFELSIGGGGNRVPAGTPVVALLTLRVPGPYAKELRLEGRVVPGTAPTTYTGGVVNDVLSCG